MVTTSCTFLLGGSDRCLMYVCTYVCNGIHVVINVWELCMRPSMNNLIGSSYCILNSLESAYYRTKKHSLRLFSIHESVTM